MKEDNTSSIRNTQVIVNTSSDLERVIGAVRKLNYKPSSEFEAAVRSALPARIYLNGEQFSEHCFDPELSGSYRYGWDRVRNNSCKNFPLISIEALEAVAHKQQESVSELSFPLLIQCRSLPERDACVSFLCAHGFKIHGTDASITGEEYTRHWAHNGVRHMTVKVCEHGRISGTVAGGDFGNAETLQGFFENASIIEQFLGGQKEPEPVMPTINGYGGIYTGRSFVQYGCAEISTQLIRELLEERGGNRSIKEVTLDSGVEITRDELEDIQTYIEWYDKKNSKV